jgi:hypothetical protein
VDLNPGSENLEVLRTKTISLIPTTRPVQTGISAIPDLGRAGKWGCEPRGAPPLGRHHEQVTLLNICSLGMYRTQQRDGEVMRVYQHYKVQSTKRGGVASGTYRGNICSRG